MKRLIVCCDGTWQSLKSNHPTNVVKIAQAVKSSDKKGIKQIVYYDEGVGTESRNKFLGGAFGKGLSKNIIDAYLFLCLNYEKNDEVYLFGFSRGAYTVRSLAGFIYCSGLLTRDKIRDIPRAYKFYRKDYNEADVADADIVKFREEHGLHIPIHVLGCWDTVGSLGIPNFLPWLPKIINRKLKFQFHDHNLNKKIKYAFHAVAID
ncbi:MAG: DUF2235 domain-containing protein, partial [Spirochaetes bacterium]|nr:DUF2235 domain-containing protein [Spirochaetota bacterium]